MCVCACVSVRVNPKTFSTCQLVVTEGKGDLGVTSYLTDADGNVIDPFIAHVLSCLATGSQIRAHIMCICIYRQCWCFCHTLFYLWLTLQEILEVAVLPHAGLSAHSVSFPFPRQCSAQIYIGSGWLYPWNRERWKEYALEVKRHPPCCCSFWIWLKCKSLS